MVEVIRWLRADPLGLVGAYWGLRLCVGLLWSEAKERLNATAPHPKARR